ncbi:hypothetical protein ACMYYO_06495 [Dermacoccaceae bacterium W4C1]
MRIDCTNCPVRQVNCDDCMVTALLTVTGSELAPDATERRALSALAAAGLISDQEQASAMARREPGMPARGWASVG